MYNYLDLLLDLTWLNFWGEESYSTLKILSPFFMTSETHFSHFPFINYTLNGTSNQVFSEKTEIYW